MQSLRLLTNNKLVKTLRSSVTAPWIFQLAQVQNRNSALKGSGQMVFFFLKRERGKNSTNNSFQTGRYWSVVSVWKLTRSQITGAYKQPFTRFCHTNSAAYPPVHTILLTFWNFSMTWGTHHLHCGYQRHTGLPKYSAKHYKALHQQKPQFEIMLHPYREVTAVIELLLLKRRYTFKEGI